MAEFQNKQLVRIVRPPALLRTSDPGVTVYFGRVLKMRQIDGEALYTVGGPVDDDAGQLWSSEFKAHELEAA
jgi:hypothetical protein